LLPDEEVRLVDEAADRSPEEVPVRSAEPLCVVDEPLPVEPAVLPLCVVDEPLPVEPAVLPVCVLDAPLPVEPVLLPVEFMLIELDPEPIPAQDASTNVPE